jgi:hypothetical protein
MRKQPRSTNAQLAAVAKRKRLQTEAHLGMPIAEWRLKKRQQWRAVMNAMSLFTYGCAYTPAGNDLYEMQKAADRINDAMQADWVCW